MSSQCLKAKPNSPSLETNLVGFCHFSKAFLCFLDQGFSATKKRKNTR